MFRTKRDLRQGDMIGYSYSTAGDKPVGGSLSKLPF